MNVGREIPTLMTIILFYILLIFYNNPSCDFKQNVKINNYFYYLYT